MCLLWNAYFYDINGISFSCRTEDIYDFVYIDAFGKGKQLTAKECEYLIGHQVTADYYSAISTTEVLLRMVGNLLNIGKRG